MTNNDSDHWPPWDRGSSIAPGSDRCLACGYPNTSAHPPLCFGGLGAKPATCQNSECQRLRSTVEQVTKEWLERSPQGLTAAQVAWVAWLFKTALGVG